MLSPLHRPYRARLPAPALVVVSALLFCIGPAAGAPGDITTVAGRTFAGDGGPAIGARLSSTRGVCVDGAGNLYVADKDNHRVRMVDRFGVITTVAGNGEKGFSGNGGLATDASLDLPEGVFVDASGSLYIADTGNSQIRKVDAVGVITTVAGSGEVGFSGDGGPGTDASLSRPTAVFVDASGDLYISDSENNRVRKLDRETGTIETVAGDGFNEFSGDGGPATSTSLSSPQGIFGDPKGNLYIADMVNNRIRKVDRAGTITTVAGDGFSRFDPGEEMLVGRFSGDDGPVIGDN